MDEGLLKEDRDMLCALSGLVFFPVSIIMMGLVMYYVGGATVAFVSIVMLIAILLGFSAIETWSDRYGKDNKDL